MNKEELQLTLCEDLKRFHEANKNLELYYDECRNKNIEPDNQKVIDLNDAVWDSIQTACGYLEEVNNDFIENIYNLGTIGNELLIFAEAFRNITMKTKIEDSRRFLIYWDESYFNGPTSSILTPDDIIEEKGWDEEARKEVLTLKLHEQYRDTGIVLVRVK